MKKRLLAMLIALCMIASLFPLSAFAEEPELEAITEETIESYDALDAYAEPESYVESPHEHAYVPYVTEPTCTTQGYTTYVCSCGESYVDNYIDALNHPQVIDIAEIPATCTTDGVTAGKQCALCGQILEGCEVIPATGHFSMDVAEIHATETSTGITAGTKCAVCGEILSGCEAIPVLMPITEPEPASEAADLTTKDELAQPGEEAFEQPAQEEQNSAAVEVEKDSEETEETIVGEGEDNLISHEAKNTGESNVIASGYVHYDDPVAWELTADGTLTIRPTSAIPAYHMEYLNSWTCWYEHGFGVGDGVDFTQNIKKLVIENGVTRILDGEFKDHTQLTDVSIADTITYIGQEAFRGCTSLRSFPALPNISCVQKRTFEGCVSLKEFTVLTGMIEESAFGGCTNLTTVTLKEGVDAIGISAFSNCPNLSSILIPDSLITIHYWAFNGDTNLTSITFGKGITSLGENLFNGSGLQTVTFTGPGTDALFDRLAFNEITANVYYPDDGTWDNKIGDYGGHLTWIPTASTVCSVTHGDHVRGDPVRENDKEPTYTTAGSYDEVVYCSACGNELSRDNKVYGKPNKLPAPVLSSVSNVNGGVQVKWGKVTGATSYNVYRKASGESSWTLIKNGVTALGFTDKSAVSGTKYRYSVKAVVKEGDKTTVSTLAASKAVTYIAAPVISSIGKDNAGVKIKWAKVAGAAQYRVYRKTGSGNWAKLGDTTAVSWTDKKTQNGTTYSYTVRCLSADGKSYTSSYDKAGKTITPVANPAVPTLTLNVKGVKVAWSKVAGATRYRVYRKAGNGNWTKVKDTTSLSCLDTGVTSNTQYSYTIRCLSDDGKLYTSGYSTTGKTIKYIAAPGVPTLTATSGKVTVKWAKVAGAAKYRVLRKTGNGSWEKLGDTTGLTWTDDTVKSGTLYTYTIRCISLIGNSYTSAYNTTGSTIKAK